jgi:glyoxalase family protein
MEFRTTFAFNSDMITGIHHVSAITGDGQRNIDFYSGLLGLKLVKLTVNFDDPSTYHLYYGDELGRPGSILTFFVWAGAQRGRIGPPQVSAVSFSIPRDAIGFWTDRFRQHDVSYMQPMTRFGEQIVRFSDPEGMQLELVAGSKRDSRMPWTGSGIPFDSAIRGLHSITLTEEAYEHTAALLTNTLAFKPQWQEGNRYRFGAGDASAGTLVDIVCMPEPRQGAMGAGTVHHLALRTPDDEKQVEWHRTLANAGYNTSPVLDRTYFRSIYFREPGGILFEVATDGPGFTIDEPLDKLGSGLRLPRWLEGARPQIEQMLTPLRLPGQQPETGQEEAAT